MFNHIRNWLISLPRTGKRSLMLAYDAIALSFALWASIAIRKGTLSVEIDPLLPVLATVLLVSIVVFIKLGLYRAVIRYLGIDTLHTLLIGVTVSTLTLATVILLFNVPVFPRSSLFIYWLLATLLIGGSRFLARDFIRSEKRHRDTQGQNTLIYGAGEAGSQLASLLNHNQELRILGFIDDDKNLHGSRVNGLPVYPEHDLGILFDKLNVQQILLAMPNISHARRRTIIDSLEPYPVHVYTVPSIDEILSGKAKVDELREIEIDDLLGRDIVAPNQALLHACVTDKIVLITGAGGSIGSELCRQIVSLQPRLLILLEASEFALYQIERELLTCNNTPPPIRSLLGNVQDEQHMRYIMQHFGVQTIYHAAAYKHVPIVEHNIEQGIRNNILGTLAAARAAIDTEVETFVLISTDKAVRPANVMGASKRFAELILQALAQEQTETRFCMVRFGNVLGSSGSVIPVFREQIKNGGPVTVTHPEIIRYFMTIPEAAQLVIQAGSMGTGGDVFVLDMGKPVNITDLATKMIRLMGKTAKTDNNPHGEITIEYTGLRPGEKLYEELLIGDNVTGTEHPMIMRAEEYSLPWQTIEQFLTQIKQGIQQHDIIQLRATLMSAVTGYKPSSPLVDHLNQQTTQEIPPPAVH